MSASDERGEPSLDDYAAADLLDKNDAVQLETAQVQAKNWLPALTSLTALITSVVVLKGPEKTIDLSEGQRWGVAGVGAAAFALLALGIWLAYIAQFGKPGTDPLLDRQRLDGLADRIRKEQRKLADESRQSLKRALLSTVVGIALVLVANGVTWFPPAGKEPASKNVCVSVDGNQVLVVSGESLDVSKVAKGASVKPCA